MRRYTSRLVPDDHTRATAGYVLGGAALSAPVLAGSAVVLSSASAFLLAIAAFLIGGFAASYRLEPRGRGELEVGQKEHCGCSTVSQQYVAVEPSERDRLVGWGCAGVAAAGAATLLVLLVV